MFGQFWKFLSFESFRLLLAEVQIAHLAYTISTLRFPVSRTGNIKFPVREREDEIRRENGKTRNPVSRNAMPNPSPLRSSSSH